MSKTIREQVVDAILPLLADEYQRGHDDGHAEGERLGFQRGLAEVAATGRVSHSSSLPGSGVQDEQTGDAPQPERPKHQPNSATLENWCDDCNESWPCTGYGLALRELALAAAASPPPSADPPTISNEDYRLLRDAATVLDRLAPTCAMSVRTWANRAKRADYSEAAAAPPPSATPSEPGPDLATQWGVPEAVLVAVARAIDTRYQMHRRSGMDDQQKVDREQAADDALFTAIDDAAREPFTGYRPNAPAAPVVGDEELGELLYKERHPDGEWGYVHPDDRARWIAAARAVRTALDPQPAPQDEEDER